MKKLLLHEVGRATVLSLMYDYIQEGKFEEAMDCQIMYLYYTDEIFHLRNKHSTEYWSLRFAILGEKW